MPYCPNCGVELETTAPACPLCGEPTRRGNEAACPTPRPTERVTDRRSRSLLLWEIVTVSAIIAAIVVVGADILTSGSLTWSLYVLSSLAAVWLVLSAVYLLAGWARFALLAVTPPALLVALNLIGGTLSWALTIGIPIALASEVSVGLGVLAGIRSKRRGVNLPAYGLLGAALTCLVVEGSLDLAFGGAIHLSWSLIVASATVPVAVFLLYLHVRVFGDTKVRRFIRL